MLVGFTDSCLQVPLSGLRGRLRTLACILSRKSCSNSSLARDIIYSVNNQKTISCS